MPRARPLMLGALLLALVALACHLLRRPAPEDTLQAVPERDPGKPPLRVLFVGNSYTFVNDLPSLIGGLASSAGERFRLEAVEDCPGGASLKQHWESGRASLLLEQSHFDWMVVQGQSEELSFDRNQLETSVYPYIQRLADAATRTGARPLLFMTWGHRDGDRANVPGDTYDAMQDRLEKGYDVIGVRLNLQVAPVGIAWRNAVRAGTGAPLWAPDGSHPSLAGSYLAACVLAGILFGDSPAGDPFTAGLDAATARNLQDVAADELRR